MIIGSFTRVLHAGMTLLQGCWSFGFRQVTQITRYGKNLFSSLIARIGDCFQKTAATIPVASERRDNKESSQSQIKKNCQKPVTIAYVTTEQVDDTNRPLPYQTVAFKLHDLLVKKSAIPLQKENNPKTADFIILLCCNEQNTETMKLLPFESTMIGLDDPSKTSHDFDNLTARKIATIIISNSLEDYFLEQRKKPGENFIKPNDLCSVRSIIRLQQVAYKNQVIDRTSEKYVNTLYKFLVCNGDDFDFSSETLSKIDHLVGIITSHT